MDELAAVRAAFAGPEPPRGSEPPGTSAVLLPIYVDRSGPSLLYEIRSAALARHAGEVSFPGGRVDPTDATPLAAALREAEEEVGIRPASVDVLGHLADYTTYYGRLVVAYVGVVRDAPPREPASRDEVEAVFLAPVRDLLAARGYYGLVHEDTPDRVVHYWRLPKATMWGITGEITARFLARAYGWTPPGAPRVVTEVSDFLPR